MTPTRIRTLLGIAGVLAVLTWAGLRIGIRDGSITRLPSLPWSLPAAIALVAAGVLAAAFGLRGRLTGRRGAKPVDPLHAARMAVLAKACSHGGAVLAGVYAGLAGWVLPDLAPSARRVQFVMAVFSAAASVLLVVAGLVLERICRLPDPPEAERDAPRVPGQR